VFENFFSRTNDLLERNFSVYLYASLLMLLFNLFFIYNITTTWTYSSYVKIVLLILPLYFAFPSLMLLIRLDKYRRITNEKYIDIIVKERENAQNGIEMLIELNRRIWQTSRMFLIYIIMGALMVVATPIILQVFYTW
jgi:hypothetical protein